MKQLSRILLLFALLQGAVSAYAQNGTVVGSPTFGTGKFGNGVTAVSDSNYLTLPTGSVSNATTPPFTYEAWVNTTSSAAGPFVAVFLGSNPSSQTWIGVASGKGTAAFFGATNLNSTASINDGAWHHLAVSGSGTTGKFFVDGVLVGSFSGMSVPQTFTTTSGYIGRYISTGFSFPGAIDEVATWNTNRYTAAFTPPTSAYAGTESGLVTLFHLQADATNSASTALSVGSLTATPSQGTVTLSLSSAASGGTGTGFFYNIFRSTTPNFTPNSSTALAMSNTTLGSTPLVDATVLPGAQYFYGVQAGDSGTDAVYSVPSGIGIWSPSYMPFASANVSAAPTPSVPALESSLISKPVCIVFMGDSITEGVGVTNIGTVLSPTMPYFAIQRVSNLLGMNNIYGTNAGVNGTTTTDWAPGGTDYNAATSAMTTLTSAHPGCLQVFSEMLGTNDSASTVTNNSPAGSATPAVYATKQSAIISALLSSFPNAIVVVHDAPYYTPNTHNSATYEQAGLNFLYSYRFALASVVYGYKDTFPKQVFLGDTESFRYFAQNYQAELQPDTSGPNGTFYLHPSGTAGSNGLIGTQSLGDFHGTAIANAIRANLLASSRYSFQ